MKIGYADPPYPGQSAKHYSDHSDYDGEVDHRKLLQRLDDEYDGWLLHTSSTALANVLYWADEMGVGGYRVMAWVKPFAAFKRNVSVAYAWEPVLVKSVRKPVVSHRVVMRDWFAESIVFKRGLTGVKPEPVCHWLFEMLGAEPSDELCDLFPGTGAVTRAWDTWRTGVTNTGSSKLNREVNMTERSDWYKAMAAATKKRERALAMRARWNEQVYDAEQAIKELSKNLTVSNTEQEQE